MVTRGSLVCSSFKSGRALARAQLTQDYRLLVQEEEKTRAFGRTGKQKRCSWLDVSCMMLLYDFEI
jgi:hypothetical protein